MAFTFRVNNNLRVILNNAVLSQKNGVTTMKKSILFSVAFMFAVANAVIAGERASEFGVSLFKTSPSRLYHAIKDKTLLDAASQISMRSGIEFKIDRSVQSDVLSKKIAADDWPSALGQLLSGYNYTSVRSGGKIQTVLVTGRNGSGLPPQTSALANGMRFSLTPEKAKLPARYRNYAPGSVIPLTLPMAKLKQSKLGQSVLLDLPIGQYPVNHDDLVDDGNGEMTWMGYLQDEGKGYRVFLSQGDAGIMGNIATPDGAYEVETVDGQTYLVDPVRAGLGLGEYGNDQAEHSLPALTQAVDVAINRLPASMAAQPLIPPGEISGLSITPTATAGTPVVDVMVLYTTVKQTATYAKQRIKYLVNVSNRAYQDSFINMRLRLVHTRPTAYTERGSNSLALADLAGAKGSFAGVPALRNQYGADLVLLLRPYYVNASKNCGIAYVGFSRGSGADAGSAFGVISDGKSREAPTNYYCGLSTFTHEVGHILGTVHDRVYSGFPGKFSYSYAWGIDNKFGTIMSYYGPSVMLFATPKLPTQCVGLPCGYAEGKPNSSDQTRTINFTGPYVAKYRATKVTTPVIQ